MIFRQVFPGILCALLCAGSVMAEEDFLLTDNGIGNILGAKLPRMKSGATVEWVEEGPYATTGEFLKTTVRSDTGRSRLLDGNGYGSGNASCFGSWKGGAYYGTFTINLNAPYLIRRVTLWSAQTPQRGIESFTVLLSRDGVQFIEAGTCVVPVEMDGPEEKPVRSKPLELVLEKPALAQYVQIRALKRASRKQAIISEVAIWGISPPKGADLVELSPENRRPEVVLRITGIGSGAATLDWSGFAAAATVKRYRLYRAKAPFHEITGAGVERIAELPVKTTRQVIFPLNPGEEFHYGVTAVYDDGEYPRAESVAFAPHEVFHYERFRDMLGICHFWNGGGANAGGLTDAWREVVLDMLGTSPFGSIRWWLCPPGIVKKFYQRGIEVTASANSPSLAVSEETGVRMFCSMNEPHLAGITPEKMAETVRSQYREIRRVNPHNRLYAPTVGLNEHSVEYAERFYAAGAKEFFDAFDLHAYIGTTADYRQPEGYPPGSPEAMFDRVAKFKAIMAKHGDENKPLICSEFGYSDSRTANPSGELAPDRKAEWLVRGMIIFNVLGFRRVYLYAFFDEGSDPDYTEHLFGIVTRDLQKKPAFQALKVLADLLGDTVFDKPLKGVSEPDFGYCYRRVDGKGFVSVVWNGATERSGTFRTVPGEVEVVSMSGERRRISTHSDGTFRCRFGGKPVYLSGSAPVELLTSVVVAESEPRGARIAVVPEREVVVVPSGTIPEAVFRLANPLEEKLKVSLELRDGAGKAVAEREVELAAREERQERFPLPEHSESALERCILAVDYDGRYQSYSESATVWVRRLAASSKETQVFQSRFEGVAAPVWLLTNDALEITVDASRGGMILELVDKRTLANQVTTPYPLLGRVESTPFHYCVWDSVRLPAELRSRITFNRKTAYHAERTEKGVRLSAGEDEIFGVEKVLTLDGAELHWETTLTNRFDGPVKCSWYLHPEYTVGGVAESFSDYLLLPLEKGEYKLQYWSGLGEKRMPSPVAGWWRFVDPVAKYRIVQEYSLKEFRAPRFWFGVGSCNVEMESVPLTLEPGGSWRGSLRWKFERF